MLLQNMGYSLQGNKKTLHGNDNPDRNQQLQLAGRLRVHSYTDGWRPCPIDGRRSGSFYACLIRNPSWNSVDCIGKYPANRVPRAPCDFISGWIWSLAPFSATGLTVISYLRNLVGLV